MLSLLKLHVLSSRHYEQLWHRSKVHFAANRKLSMETLTKHGHSAQNNCFSNFQKIAPAAATRPSTLYTLHSRKNFACCCCCCCITGANASPASLLDTFAYSSSSCVSDYFCFYQKCSYVRERTNSSFNCFYQ